MTLLMLSAATVLVALLLGAAALIRRWHLAREADAPTVTGSVRDMGSLLVLAVLLAVAGLVVGAAATFLLDKLAGNVGMAAAVGMTIIGTAAFAWREWG